MNHRHLLLPPISMLFLVLLASGAIAIGISPARAIIDFEPNLQKTMSFDVTNNAGSQMDVELYVKGDLQQYITLVETKTVLASGESKTFYYDLKLPATLEPGTHDNRIGALESYPETSGGGAQVGARTGVEMQLWVKVPYPGKYAKVSLSAGNVKSGETVEFALDVQNLGTQDFTASGRIDMFSAGGAKIATVQTNSITVVPKSSGRLTAKWDTTGVQAGAYTAKATVNYDENTATADTSFNVGGLIVNILDVIVGKIKKDTIAKFTIKVESMWNDEIKAVFADLFFFDKTSQQIAKAKSESVDVPGNGNAEMNAFWDAAGLATGTYQVKVVLNYAGKTSEKIIDVEIVEESAANSGFNIPIWLIAVVSAVAAVVLVVVYIIRMKSKV